MTSPILVTASTVAQRINDADVVILDTRDKTAFAAGHIPGSVNLPEIFSHLAASSPDGLSDLRETFARLFGEAGLSGTEVAVLVEESMDSGFGRSCRGAFLLAWLGYPAFVILDGGMAAWRAAGLELTLEPSSPVRKRFPSSPPTLNLMATQADVLKVLNEPDGTVLIDVRDVDEWTGSSSSPYGVDFCPRKGRIPGARWLEWYRMMKPSPSGTRFKTPSEIMADCETVSIDLDTSVILYCFKGARAANTWVALRSAGFKDVRIYLGSWNEWSRDGDLPIEEGPRVAVANSDGLTQLRMKRQDRC